MRPILQWIDKVSEDDSETGFVYDLFIHLFICFSASFKLFFLVYKYN
ncbi:unnamed protein product [Brugia timori]|uniref:Uncharacterized protein n=1 Tax=Brugia timori TaxID=42155 RepID=A0A0R3RBZ6_9BILA|nr:unnamed protein product [Brugia timori]